MAGPKTELANQVTLCFNCPWDRDSDDVSIPKVVVHRGRGVRSCRPDWRTLKIVVTTIAAIGLILSCVYFVSRTTARHSQPSHGRTHHSAKGLPPYQPSHARTHHFAKGLPPYQSSHARTHHFAKGLAPYDNWIQATLDGIMKGIGMTPDRLSHYRDALNFADKTIIRKEGREFFRSPRNIISHIKTLYAHLSLKGKTPGYRTKWGEVGEWDDKWLTDRALERAQKKKFSQIDMNILKGSFHKFDYKIGQAFNLTHIMSSLTSEEMRVWGNTVLFHTPPLFIASNMEQFARSFYGIYRRASAIDLGCIAHQALIRMRPFEDDSGRNLSEDAAKILLNAFLWRGGQEYLVIHDDAAYREAYTKDLEEPGTFKDFVLETLDKMRDNSERLELPTENT